MENAVKEVPPYMFLASKQRSSVLRRDCEHCKERTVQQQGRDANGKRVEKFRCLTCLSETK